MASIANIVSLSLQAGGQAAQADNPNVVGIVTSEVGVLSSIERWRSYVDPLSVAQDFGSTSKAAAWANVFFAQSPNPVNAGGRLIIGWWRAATENYAATAAVLTGASLNEAAVVAALQQVSDGAFDIDVDGVTENVAALDFQTVLTLSDIASVIDAGMAGATVTASDGRIIITSDTTGALSTLIFATDPGSGTYIGSLLAIEDGSGAVIVDGAAAGSNAPETKVEAITELKAQTNLKGFTFIDAPTTQESKDLAAFAQANSVLGYDVFSNALDLELNSARAPWAIKLAGQKRYRTLYRADGDRKFAAGYMAREHSVNFNATNSAITMQLKEILSVPAEDLAQTVIDKAKNVGLDISVLFKSTAGLLTSGANGYTDTEYNTIAFTDELLTDMFNVLKTTSTKVPQTTPGANVLVDRAEKTSGKYVRNGVFAPGEWTSSDTFGDLETFKRAISENGYYWLAGRLSDQSPADRAARKSPVIQGALKFSGAFHSIELLVFVNE